MIYNKWLFCIKNLEFITLSSSYMPNLQIFYNYFYANFFTTYLQLMICVLDLRYCFRQLTTSPKASKKPSQTDFYSFFTIPRPLGPLPSADFAC